jgi:hypothetical protein
MNWVCLPQMLENKKTFELGFRLLMELSTPELYKLQEFTHWQPKILNNVYFVRDEEADGLIPVMSHTDLQVLNQMPHRSPGLLNPRVESFGAYSKYKISFTDTFHIIFDPKNSECLGKFMRQQYLELMALYDLEFFQETAIPELFLNLDKETVQNVELLELGLS